MASVSRGPGGGRGYRYPKYSRRVTSFDNNYQRAERKMRVARRQAIRNAGVKPAVKRWVTCVQVTAITIPQWAKDKAVKHFSVSDHFVWFRGRVRTHARMLAFEDEQAGGTPEFTTLEWRMCPRCGRPLLGLEAEARRLTDERFAQGREMPCSGECV